MDNPYKTLGSKLVYQNPWIRVREDKIVNADGSEGIYGVIETRDSVMIVALNDKNEVYLVQTFSYPDQSWNWELPGGGGDGEDAMVASKRELMEETGIAAEDWQLLGKTRVCDGLMSERQNTYLARGLSMTEGHDNEAIIGKGKFVTLTEAHRMVARGDMNDNQSIAGLYQLERWLEKNGRGRE